ncbi:Uncharacterized protein APZ42_005543 [Daphnia magna]|uniref:Uncharacterized protein n=1 Tax=Daphnia magna TaxID=35525 RepID=A0A164GE36_9CRUS|nr:Uncharacterized protein APZ42_005543 [Daphnia magna]
MKSFGLFARGCINSEPVLKRKVLKLLWLKIGSVKEMFSETCGQPVDS